MSTAEIAPGIYIARAFEAGEAAGIVAAAERATTWQSAGIDAALEVDRSVRDADVLFDSPQPADASAAALMDQCRSRLFAATRSIAAATASVPKTVLAEIQIVRYRAGGRYAQHRDTPELGATPRTLSLVCYLNDDFTGGETVFTEPAITVPILAGSVVAFSPVLMHRAEPVLRGTKYVITAWYHALPNRGETA